MENNKIKELLDKVTLIREKYDEINKITGANYNVFNVLKLQSDEVRLHSRFIGDLLNPKGKHGRDKVFLELFLEQMKDVLPIYKKSDDSNDNKVEIPDSELSREILQAKKVHNDFNPTNAKVDIEEYIGKVKTDEGGRIDLVVKDGDNIIVIENKIYANDQKQQLIRYEKEYPDALMIYLTLNGKEATTISVTPKLKKENDDKKALKSDVDYIRMSYKNNIKEWLEKCLPHTTQFPHLRESISQYLNIVKQLTGQSMNKNMDIEIKSAMFNSIASIKSSKEIAKLFDNGKKELYKTFRKELQMELDALLKDGNIYYCLNLSFKKKKWEETRTQYSFENCKEISQNIIKEEKKFENKLIFEFSRMYKDGAVQKSFYYGFRFDDSKNNNLNEEIKEKHKSLLHKISKIPNSEPKEDKEKYWKAIKYYSLDNNQIRINSNEFMVSLNNKDERNLIVNKLAKDMYDVIKVCINNTGNKIL